MVCTNRDVLSLVHDPLLNEPVQRVVIQPSWLDVSQLNFETGYFQLEVDDQLFIYPLGQLMKYLHLLWLTCVCCVCRRLRSQLSASFLTSITVMSWVPREPTYRQYPRRTMSPSSFQTVVMQNPPSLSSSYSFPFHVAIKLANVFYWICWHTCSSDGCRVHMSW